MNNHDIDTIIPPPEGGLTRTGKSVSLALARDRQGEIETTWNTGTAAQLPSDPGGPVKWCTPTPAPAHQRQPRAAVEGRRQQPARALEGRGT